MTARSDLTGVIPADPDTGIGSAPLLPVRSQDLLVTLLGRHVRLRPQAIYSGTFIDVLGAAGIGEHAARSILARMVGRELLSRRRHGRRTYYQLTDRLRDALNEGHKRIYETEPVLFHWDGTWTILGYSLPESRRADRHRLRVRLAWAGFGLLRDGLWLAPGAVDVEEVLDGLSFTDHITSFQGRAVAPTDPVGVVREAWDLKSIAAAFTGFLERWENPITPGGRANNLVRHLYLITDWRLILRESPLLPTELLPADWPAEDARARFQTLDGRWAAAAEAEFEQAVQTMAPTELAGPA